MLLYFAFCHSLCIFLNFQLLAIMLNFIFIEVTWKLSYLRWLNFVQEKWLRGHTSCIHCKMINLFQEYDDKLFPIKCELWLEVSPRIIRTRFQDPVHILWWVGHIWSPKITNFWTPKEVKKKKKTHKKKKRLRILGN